jgi:L-aspartate oxidase
MDESALNVNFEGLNTKILMQRLEYDIVVVGSGLAGLTAAFYASKYGRVAIVTKSELDTSNSWFAQGGIAAVTGSDDTVELHIGDTLEAGRGLCDYDSVEVLVDEGRKRVQELIDMGMPFDREDGEIVLGLEGGHSRRRILHAGGDATGKKLVQFMLGKVREESNIHSFEYTAVVRLLSHDGCMSGLQAIDFATGRNMLFVSRAVIMATGGLSRVYSRSTNPHTATGDGIAMAYECGAQLADLEFIQFHPSALSIPGREAFLISEAVRGEGAWLLNKSGERFMPAIHPLAELAPRDVVAYAIYREMMKTGTDSVFLSLSHLDSGYIAQRFHNIYQTLHDYGFDMTRDLLPVAPAAHYMVGGIRSGLHGETNVHGLYVCGETASTGVMGANRLASNSLLECLVFGKRASERAIQLNVVKCAEPDPEPFFLNQTTDNLYLEYRNEMATLMMKNMGIIREKKRMSDALQRFSEILSGFNDHECDYNKLKIKNMAQLCHLITHAAIMREESRGGHIREDYPDEDPAFKVHIVMQKNITPVLVPVRNKF